MTGYAIADEMIKSKKGYDAAVEEFGEGRASAPGLFTALQNQDIAANQDQRADSAEARAERVDSRAATTHAYTTETNREAQAEDGLLNMVQGLRQARDNGEDLGAAFDNLAGSLPNLGVSQEDLPAMRQELLDNPAMLDSYYAALTDAGEMAQTIENEEDGGLGGGTSEGDTTKAQQDVTATIKNMSQHYERLDELGGIKSSDVGAIRSLGRASASSGVGHSVAKKKVCAVPSRVCGPCSFNLSSKPRAWARGCSTVTPTCRCGFPSSQTRRKTFRPFAAC